MNLVIAEERCHEVDPWMGFQANRRWRRSHCFCGGNFALRMHGNLDDFFAKSVGEQLYLVVYADLAHKVEAM